MQNQGNKHNDTMERKLKYQICIDKVVALGATMPELFVANNKHSYRYVFSDNQEKNHIPVCIANPKRILPKDVMTSGYALSCFGSEEKAKERYNALKQNFKMIVKTIGDALSEGTITDNDGMVTAEAEATTHFDFYEFEQCTPAEIFTTKYQFV